MGWSSKDYHYTKEEIDKTAYAAGCGNGWYWIHKRPNMFLRGHINDDGSYSLTFYKAITSQFEYFLNISINGTIIFNFPEFSVLNKRTYKKTVTGKLPIGTQRAIVTMHCGDKHCDVGAGVSVGKEILNIDLYPYAKVYINNIWKRAMIYVYINNQWKLCYGYVFSNRWKRLSN